MRARKGGVRIPDLPARVRAAIPHPTPKYVMCVCVWWYDAVMWCGGVMWCGWWDDEGVDIVGCTGCYVRVVVCCSVLLLFWGVVVDDVLSDVGVDVVLLLVMTWLWSFFFLSFSLPSFFYFFFFFLFSFFLFFLFFFFLLLALSPWCRRERRSLPCSSDSEDFLSFFLLSFFFRSVGRDGWKSQKISHKSPKSQGNKKKKKK